MKSGTAEGQFDVATTPHETLTEEGTTTSRLGLDKVFHGDLEASSHGTMLAAGVETGSGVYVAIERVVGRLNGKQGAFVLYHLGTRTRESQSLSVTVLADSGTGELSGISGVLEILIEGEAHRYRLRYQLPE